MGEYINKLREFDKYDGYEPDETITDLEDYADYGLAIEGMNASVELVHEEFELGGRWSNYVIKVYKVTEDDVVAYFKVQKEVPATEIQYGGDFSMRFNEVKPETKTIVVYV